MIHNKFLSLLILLLSCACTSHAQDSFFNPYDFRYDIEFSSEMPEDTLSAEAGRVEVHYDDGLQSPFCTISYHDTVRYKGRIIDMQLYREHQEFMLENFFDGKHHAKMQIAVNPDLTNQKVALVYYADTRQDPSPDKTCICMLLADVIEEK